MVKLLNYGSTNIITSQKSPSTNLKVWTVNETQKSTGRTELLQESLQFQAKTKALKCVATAFANLYTAGIQKTAPLDRYTLLFITVN